LPPSLGVKQGAVNNATRCEHPRPMKLPLVIDFGDQLIPNRSVGHFKLSVGNVGLHRRTPGSGSNGAHHFIALHNERVLRWLVTLDIEHGKAVPGAFGFFGKQCRAAIKQGFREIDQPL